MVAAAKTLEMGPLITEDALADRFSELIACDWRYVAVWSAWLKWAGTRWQIDTGAVFEEIRQICRTAAVSVQSADIRRIRSDRTIRAVERIARSDPRHAALPEEFDADTMLLNTPAGVVDLRTGEIEPHRPSGAR
jgi:putative DNA primase/helicase